MLMTRGAVLPATWNYAHKLSTEADPPPSTLSLSSPPPYAAEQDVVGWRIYTATNALCGFPSTSSLQVSHRQTMSTQVLLEMF